MASNFGNFWVFSSKAELDGTGSDHGLNVGAVALVLGDQLYSVETVGASSSTSQRANRSVYMPSYHYDTLNNAAKRYPSWIKDGFVNSYGTDAESLAPFGGQLVKVVVRTSNDAGSSVVSFYRGGSEVATVQLSVGADTSVSFDFTGLDNTFSEGDTIGLALDPGSNPGETRMTGVWEFVP